MFYEELGLAEPRHPPRGRLRHATPSRPRAMLVGIERAIREQRPDGVVVYGDTNSTLAAALAAAKEQVPVAHVEAGPPQLRPAHARGGQPRRRRQPLGAAPVPVAAGGRRTSRARGSRDGVHVVGDVMVDVARLVAPAAAARSAYPGELGLEPGGYLLATVHRQSNTRGSRACGRIVEGLGSLDEPVVLPLHPRTRAALERDGLLARARAARARAAAARLRRLHRAPAAARGSASPTRAACRRRRTCTASPA